MFAPGDAITSAWPWDVGTGNASNTELRKVLSGTSMAAPHVTGVVARYLESNPCASTEQVAAAISNFAIPNHVTDPHGTDNLLLDSAFVGAPAAPSAPCGFSLEADTGLKRRVPLRWVPPSHGGSPITALKVYRSTMQHDPNPTVLASLTLPQSSYTDTTGTPNTTYFYSIGALNAVGETRSEEEPAQSIPPTVPDAPVVSGAAAHHGASLTWSIPADGGYDFAQPYKVYRGTTANDSAPTLLTPAGISTTSYTDTSVPNGGPVFYTVTATNDVGSSPPSNEVSVTPFGIDVFALNSSGGITWRRTSDAGSTTPMTPPGISTSHPSSIACGSDSATFIRGTDGGLYWQKTANGGPGGWQALGGFLTSNPIAVNEGGTNASVFVRGGDGGIYRKVIVNCVPQAGYVALGGYASSSPAATFRSGVTWVVVRGGDFGTYAQKLTSVAPASWQALGGYATSDPAVVTTAAGTTAFVRGGTEPRIGRWSSRVHRRARGLRSAASRTATSWPSPRMLPPGRCSFVAVTTASIANVRPAEAGHRSWGAEAATAIQPRSPTARSPMGVLAHQHEHDRVAPDRAGRRPDRHDRRQLRPEHRRGRTRPDGRAGGPSVRRVARRRHWCRR